MLRLRAPAARHPVAVYLASLGSRASRRATIGALKRIAAVVPTFSILSPGVYAWDAASAMQLRSLLAQRFAPSTANGSLAALRGVLRCAVLLEELPRDRYSAVCDALEPVRGSRPRPGREISADELRKLFAACEPGEAESLAGLASRPIYRSARNAAILALLYGCGLRRSELAALRVEDLDDDARRVRVAGKGNAVRLVPIGLAVWPHVAPWLALRRAPIPAAPLFIRAPDVPGSDGLSDSGVYVIVRALAVAADLPPLSPHDCRRTFVGDLLERGADVVTVAGLVGHSSVATTQRYDRRPERAQRAAVDLLDLPPTSPTHGGGGDVASALDALAAEVDAPRPLNRPKHAIR